MKGFNVILELLMPLKKVLQKFTINMVSHDFRTVLIF